MSFEVVIVVDRVSLDQVKCISWRCWFFSFGLSRWSGKFEERFCSLLYGQFWETESGLVRSGFEIHDRSTFTDLFNTQFDA
mmetsp:Transcript_11442/g.23229  ORF Transcript_11442/g.23229 Transcript_11442/m.23229 type:complete len:81 (+) Transcript_11442:252-494(+)